VRIIAGCRGAPPCTETQTHRLVTANQGDHADTIRAVYRVIGLPSACTVNGMSGSSIVLFDNTSSYAVRERKTFNVPVTYSCPQDPNLVDSAFQLRLDVDHLGDDYPLPDDDDNVPTNNTRITGKFIK
jgi:hypothetical protein